MINEYAREINGKTYVFQCEDAVSGSIFAKKLAEALESAPPEGIDDKTKLQFGFSELRFREEGGRMMVLAPDYDSLNPIAVRTNDLTKVFELENDITYTANAAHQNGVTGAKPITLFENIFVEPDALKADKKVMVRRDAENGSAWVILAAELNEDDDIIIKDEPRLVEMPAYVLVKDHHVAIQCTVLPEGSMALIEDNTITDLDNTGAELLGDRDFVITYYRIFRGRRFFYTCYEDQVKYIEKVFKVLAEVPEEELEKNIKIVMSFGVVILKQTEGGIRLLTPAHKAEDPMTTATEDLTDMLLIESVQEEMVKLYKKDAVPVSEIDNIVIEKGALEAEYAMVTKVEYDGKAYCVIRTITYDEEGNPVCPEKADSEEKPAFTLMKEGRMAMAAVLSMPVGYCAVFKNGEMEYLTDEEGNDISTEGLS
ncbi:hypothetical protein [Ruminococcus sp.]|uniref:hypothetical protein n=1 Tax=Ruminococcus sp. TaxID=41978 RepID=UPI0025FA2208|nr:hypothetical protein [Ruminococcus sp.]MBQ8966824.1 hypothetical protein [Ruminococcus sp.]